MNYILQVNAFWDKHGSKGNLSPTSIAVYFCLLHLNNMSGWKPIIKVHPREITDLTNINSPRTLYDHLRQLKKHQLIDYSTPANQYTSISLLINCLYGAEQLPEQKLPEQLPGNCEATTQQPSQVPDNQVSYKHPKLLNNKTFKHKKNKGAVFDDFENLFLNDYQTFIKKRTGVSANLNEADWQALKNIAAHLKTGKGDAAIKAWQKILTNWNKMNSYFQSKLSLYQMDKNLLSIIDQIENQNENHSASNKKTGTPADRVARKDFRF